MKCLASEANGSTYSDGPDLSTGPGGLESGAGCVTIRPFQDSDRVSWNAFVREHRDGTFFHLAEWRQILDGVFGYRTHYLLAARDGHIQGVLPLAQIRSPFIGNALVSTPFCVYGGIVAVDETAHAALEKAACDLARRLDVDYLEMRNRRRSHPDWPCRDLHVTFRKAIDADSEKNMLAIPRKQRAMVRKGIKEQLRAEVDAGVDRHYELYSASLRRLGTPVFSKRYLEVLMRTFGDACDVVTIVKGDRAVASVLNFYFRDEVLPYYGGGTSEARAVAGNDFMYWAVMDRAREQGLRIFDFGRSKRGTGSFDFKTHWGFEPEPLYYEYLLVRGKEVPDLNRTGSRFDWAMDLWSRLPLRVTQLVGPAVSKYLGW